MHLNGYLRHLNTDGDRHQGHAVKCLSANMTPVVWQFRWLHKLLTCYILSPPTSQLVGELWRALFHKQGNNWQMIHWFSYLNIPLTFQQGSLGIQLHK